MSAIALTDYNGLYGAIEFYKAAQKEEIKALIGVDIGYVYDMNIKPKQEDIGTITLLAKNYE
jgi:DNA polymerase-3 subunit alpha